MAKPSNLFDEVAQVREGAQAAGGERRRAGRNSTAAVSKVDERARRAQALSFRLAGFTEEQIAERLGISAKGVHELLERILAGAEAQGVKQLRELENSRLDRAQAAIWTRVLEGDLNAINTFLRISQHRSKINGIFAPVEIDLTVSVRNEMMQALQSLEEIVEPMIELTAIEDATIVEDDDFS